jgi:uncharacterized protein YbjT (DUF2867 family)
MGTEAPILIIGGTRGTGLLIAQRLRAQGDSVRVLARDPIRAAAQLGSAIEVVTGDITCEDTLSSAIAGAGHIVFTAGVRSGHPSREARVKAVEFQGVAHTLMAARRKGFRGRFLYMTASGVTTQSLATVLLNLYKGNTLLWRRHAEDAIRASGFDYTIIRVGVLLNARGGIHAIDVTQKVLPLSLRYRIARADVAEVFIAAIPHPRASRATFEVVWGKGRRRDDWPVLLNSLKADDAVC